MREREREIEWNVVSEIRRIGENKPDIYGCKDRGLSIFDIAWQEPLIVFQLLEVNPNFRAKRYNSDLTLNDLFWFSDTSEWL